MSPPYLFSLSNELLIEIISNLRPFDIHACQCTCRKLNDIIVNSQLIQYILRTALSGVFDSLESGISLPDRLHALERWETAWREMDLSKPIACIDSHRVVQFIFVGFNMSESEHWQPVHYFGEHHVIACQLGVPAGYSILDLHAWSSSPASVTRWTIIDIQIPNILIFAFAPELNLSIAFSAPESNNYRKLTVMISPMCFNTGEPHPLASKSKLEVTVSSEDTHNQLEAHQAIIIGDYILCWIGASIFSETDEKTTLCNIYLVAWKEGWVSELRAPPPNAYDLELSVLSEEIIMLIRLREPALELCRLANIGDKEKASLETICILCLPILTFGASLRWVSTAEEKPGHALFSKGHPLSGSCPHSTCSGTNSSTRQSECRAGARIRSVPSDGIVHLVMQMIGSSGYRCMADLIVRRRTLLEFTNPQARVDATGVAGMGLGTTLILPWEKWGPTNSRILDRGAFTWGGLSGERCAMVLISRIMMHDYNPYRVRRALALLGASEREVTLSCGSVVKVVKEASVYRGGDCFWHDVETSLPYVETITSYDGCLDVCMDENYLVVEVFTPVSHIHLGLSLHALSDE